MIGEEQARLGTLKMMPAKAFQYQFLANTCHTRSQHTARLLVYVSLYFTTLISWSHILYECKQHYDDISVWDRSCDMTASYLCVCHQRLSHPLVPLLPLFASRGVQAQKSCPGSLVGTCSGLHPLYRSQWTGMQTDLFPEGEKPERETERESQMYNTTVNSKELYCHSNLTQAFSKTKHCGTN